MNAVFGQSYKCTFQVSMKQKMISNEFTNEDSLYLAVEFNYTTQQYLMKDNDNDSIYSVTLQLDSGVYYYSYFYINPNSGNRTDEEIENKRVINLNHNRSVLDTFGILKKFSLRIVVLNQRDSSPVSDVDVQLYNGFYYNGSYTDSTGGVNFDVFNGNYRISFYKENFFDTSFNLIMDTNITLVKYLRPYPKYKFYVYDSVGPLQGASIYIDGLYYYTDSLGYAFYMPGYYISENYALISYENYAKRCVYLPIIERDTTIRLKLYPQPKLNFIFKDTSGNTIPNLRISLSSSEDCYYLDPIIEPELITNKNGIATWNAYFLGKLKLHLSDYRYGNLDSVITIDTNENQSFTFCLTPLPKAHITIHTLDTLGNPLSVQIRIFSFNSNYIYNGSINDNGILNIDLVKNNYYFLEINKTGYDKQYDLFYLSNDTAINYIFSPLASLSIRCYDSINNNIIKNFNTKIFAIRNTYFIDSYDIGSFKSDSNGLILCSVPKDTIKLRISAYGYETLDTNVLIGKSPQSLEFFLPPKRKYKAEFYVYDINGLPLDSVKVSFWGNEPDVEYYTNLYGYVNINLIGTYYSIIFSKPGYWDYNLDDFVLDQDTTKIITMRRKKDSVQYTFNVKDEQNNPVNNAYVVIYGEEDVEKVKDTFEVKINNGYGKLSIYKPYDNYQWLRCKLVKFGYQEQDFSLETRNDTVVNLVFDQNPVDIDSMEFIVKDAATGKPLKNVLLQVEDVYKYYTDTSGYVKIYFGKFYQYFRFTKSGYWNGYIYYDEYHDQDYPYRDTIFMEPIIPVTIKVVSKDHALPYGHIEIKKYSDLDSMFFGYNDLYLGETGTAAANFEKGLYRFHIFYDSYCNSSVDTLINIDYQPSYNFVFDIDCDNVPSSKDTVNIVLTVIDTNGNPEQNLPLYLDYRFIRNSEHEEYIDTLVYTNKDGKVYLSLPNLGSLDINYTSYYRLDSNIEYTIISDTNLLLKVIKYPLHTLYVVTKDNIPIANAKISLCSEDFDDSFDSFYTDSSGYASKNLMIDTSEIDLDMPMGYNISINKYGFYPLFTVWSFPVNKPDTQTIVLDPFLYGNIEFNVSDGSNPIEGAKIDIASHQLVTNAQGKAYDILPFANYNFNVSKDGYKSYSASIDIEQASVSVNIVLQKVVSGIDELKNIVQVYPNPSRGYFNILNAAGTKLSITDLTGKIIFSQRIYSNKERINLSAAPQGIYLLYIEKGNSTYMVKLIKY